MPRHAGPGLQVCLALCTNGLTSGVEQTVGAMGVGAATSSNWTFVCVASHSVAVPILV